MSTISLCMIVKNEEDVLARCLTSVADLVDEIIIVDTGSTDGTKAIAAEFTDKIYDYQWIDDFSEARNYSFSLANCLYCMWLDADDVFLEADRLAFAQMKAELPSSTDVVMMKYNTGFDAKGNVTFAYYRERIIKNHLGMRWKGAVHEVIETLGTVEYSQCAVTHQKLHPSDPDRNLRIFEKLLDQGISLDPRQQFYYGRELYYHKRFEDAIRIFESFWRRTQAGSRTRLTHAATTPIAGIGWGTATRPSKRFCAAFCTIPHGQRCAVKLAVTSLTGPGILWQFTGMNVPWTASGRMCGAGLFLRMPTAIRRAFSCVSVIPR